MLRQREQCEKRSGGMAGPSGLGCRKTEKSGWGPRAILLAMLVQVEGALTLHSLNRDHPLPGELSDSKTKAKLHPTPAPPLQVKKCQFPPLETIIQQEALLSDGQKQLERKQA